MGRVLKVGQSAGKEGIGEDVEAEILGEFSDSFEILGEFHYDFEILGEFHYNFEILGEFRYSFEILGEFRYGLALWRYRWLFR